MNKYDYVKYDQDHIEMQNKARELHEKLDEVITNKVNQMLPSFDNAQNFAMLSRFTDW